MSLGCGYFVDLGHEGCYITLYSGSAWRKRFFPTMKRNCLGRPLRLSRAGKLLRNSSMKNLLSRTSSFLSETFQQQDEMDSQLLMCKRGYGISGPSRDISFRP
mmetsp:Transcript_16693/g.34303  ORF Transcript_16693/g.34303 Transcript_16693/m.34303 type:complete len:103 (-) Transcript_16693:2723-3031(-)